MPSILFLDDDPLRCARFRTLYADAVIANTAPQAIAALQAQGWALVCLDHDLGGEY